MGTYRSNPSTYSSPLSDTPEGLSRHWRDGRASDRSPAVVIQSRFCRWRGADHAALAALLAAPEGPAFAAPVASRGALPTPSAGSRGTGGPPDAQHRRDLGAQ